MKNELRTDFLGRRVLISAQRGLRPRELKERGKRKATRKKCVFCDGNEEKTPPETGRVEKDGKWIARSFYNKFPALKKENPYAYGAHEVVVETPEHSRDLGDLEVTHTAKVIELIGERVAEISKDRKIRAFSIFKNKGKNAGASLEHSHIQLMALGEVSELARKISKVSKKRNCRICEIEKQSEMLYGNKNASALAPLASRFEGEVLIKPKRHVKSITELRSDEVKSIALALKKCLSTINKLMDYPAYNIVFQECPPALKDYHFHISVYPRVEVWAGFEYSTDIIINILPPEVFAEDFRKAVGK